MRSWSRRVVKGANFFPLLSRGFAATLLITVAACGTETDERPASWSYVAAAIIEPNCSTAGCHSRLSRVAGLELDNRDSAYTFLVGDPARGDFVVPGQPDVSQLVKLLRGDEIRRMPPDQPLPEADIQLIERWILDGARKN